MITVLIPIYNGIEFIHESVSSVIHQTFENWELIIGINGHEENSAVLNTAKQYECDKIRVIDMPHINNKSTALNEMVKYATYDFIALLDVDDIWMSNKLEIQSAFLNQYDVIGTKCVYFGERLCGVIPDIPVEDISGFDFFKTNPVINSSAIIRKEYCLWDGSLNLEDYDLWLRLRKQGRRFYNCREICVQHRLHQTSAFNNTNSGNVSILLQRHERD
jgi:glycosyltransferase EpsE